MAGGRPGEHWSSAGHAGGHVGGGAIGSRRHGPGRRRQVGTSDNETTPNWCPAGSPPAGPPSYQAAKPARSAVRPAQSETHWSAACFSDCVWSGGMTLTGKAICEHRVSSGTNRESGCSAMRNGGIGHNASTAPPRQRCESRNYNLSNRPRKRLADSVTRRRAGPPGGMGAGAAGSRRQTGVRIAPSSPIGLWGCRGSNARFRSSLRWLDALEASMTGTGAYDAEVMKAREAAYRNHVRDEVF